MKPGTPKHQRLRGLPPSLQLSARPQDEKIKIDRPSKEGKKLLGKKKEETRQGAPFSVQSFARSTPPLKKAIS